MSLSTTERLSNYVNGFLSITTRGLYSELNISCLVKCKEGTVAEKKIEKEAKE